MPVGMFPVLFAIPRTSGWIAQWLEMIDDKEQKIARPRQIYTGERARDYVPIGERSLDRHLASIGAWRLHHATVLRLLDGTHDPRRSSRGQGPARRRARAS